MSLQDILGLTQLRPPWCDGLLQMLALWLWPGGSCLDMVAESVWWLWFSLAQMFVFDQNLTRFLYLF